MITILMAALKGVLAPLWALLSSIPPKAWEIIALVAFLVVSLLVYGSHERSIGVLETTAVWSKKMEAQTDAYKKQQDFAQKVRDAESLNRETVQQENLHEAQQQAAAALAARAAAVDTDVKLRNQLNAVILAFGRSAGGSDPGPTTGSPDASAAIPVLGGLFGEADDFAGVLADALAESRTSNELCERDYDALKVRSSLPPPAHGS